MSSYSRTNVVSKVSKQEAEREFMVLKYRRRPTYSTFWSFVISVRSPPEERVIPIQMKGLEWEWEMVSQAQIT